MSGDISPGSCGSYAAMRDGDAEKSSARGTLAGLPATPHREAFQGLYLRTSTRTILSFLGYGACVWFPLWLLEI